MLLLLCLSAAANLALALLLLAAWSAYRGARDEAQESEKGRNREAHKVAGLALEVRRLTVRRDAMETAATHAAAERDALREQRNAAWADNELAGAALALAQLERDVTRAKLAEAQAEVERLTAEQRPTIRGPWSGRSV